jgi:hypothetical protein
MLHGTQHRISAGSRLRFRYEKLSNGNVAKNRLLPFQIAES